MIRSEWGGSCARGESCCCGILSKRVREPAAGAIASRRVLLRTRCLRWSCTASRRRSGSCTRRGRLRRGSREEWVVGESSRCRCDCGKRRVRLLQRQFARGRDRRFPPFLRLIRLDRWGECSRGRERRDRRERQQLRASGCCRLDRGRSFFVVCSRDRARRGGRGGRAHRGRSRR